MPSLPPPPTLVLMLKAPIAGRVKTRLAAEIGAVTAREAYRALVEHQMTQLPADYPIEIHFTPSEEKPLMEKWLGSRPSYFPQCEGHLGERLSHAMFGAFSRGASRLLFLGGDCPALSHALIKDATQVLTPGRIVLGPATDGGYYLLGISTIARELFIDISWSTPRVLKETLQQAARCQLTPHLLPFHEDVDDLASWTRAQSLLPLSTDRSSTKKSFDQHDTR
jgi:uncharacterized protein